MPAPQRNHAVAWLLLCLALAIHVFDEATHDFLSVYNPSVRALRARIPWAPIPLFEFREWLAGLIIAVSALIVLAWGVRAGWRWLVPASYVFAAIMLANGLGHVAGSVLSGSLMPGVLSSPLLLGAAVFLLVATMRRQRLPAGTR